MSQEPTTTKMVGSSNIGFVLGILVVVAIAMYLFKSGFIANRFGLGSQPTPTPTPSTTPLVDVTDEPITLLDETETDETDDTDDTTSDKVAETNKNATTSARTHKPVDTALGDNPAYLMLMLLMGAGILGVAAKKLA